MSVNEDVCRVESWLGPELKTLSGSETLFTVSVTVERP
jgi:hypothetical protein